MASYFAQTPDAPAEEAPPLDPAAAAPPVPQPVGSYFAPPVNAAPPPAPGPDYSNPNVPAFTAPFAITSAQERAQQPQSQAQPAPQPRPGASPDAVPEDAFSGFTDPIRAVQEADGILGKAGALIGGLANSSYGRGRDIVGQMGRDAALHGDPYRTTGEYTPEGIAQDPSKVLSAFPVLVNTLGGPHGPQDATDGFYDFYTDPANVEAAEARYAATGDIGVYYDLYEESQHRTLETGGLGGAARGMIRGVGTDVGTLPMAALGAAAGTTATIARQAGQVGIARGVSAAGQAANIAYDPTDLALSGLGRAVGGIFAPSEQTKRAAGRQGLDEALTSAADATAGYVPEPVAAPVAGPPIPGAVQSYPVVAPPPELGPPALSANVSLAPTQPMGDPFAAAPPEPFPISPDVVWQQPAPRQSFPQLAQPPVRRTRTTVAEQPGALNPERGISMMPDAVGRPVFTWDDGAEITRRDFDAAYTEMQRVPPTEFPLTDAPTSYWSRMRAAMTASGFMYDDWPAAKRLAGRGLSRPEAAMAGKRFVDLVAERVRLYADEEVQRLADNFQLRAVENPDGGINMSNRALALSEALTKAGYAKPVLFRHNGGTIRYTPAAASTADPIVGRTPSRPAPVAPPVATPDDALFDRMLLKTSGADLRTRETLRRMLDDPDAFGTAIPEYVATRKSLYRRTTTGKPLKEGGEPYWVKPGTPSAQKYPAALARYQEFYQAWQARTGGPQEMPTQAEYAPLIDPVLNARSGRGDQLSAFSASLNLSNAIASDPRVAGALRDTLNEMGLRDVGLAVTMTRGGGTYNPAQNLITVGTRLTLVGLDALPFERLVTIVDHEAIHAIRSLGLFTDDEWQTLLRAGAAQPSWRNPQKTISAWVHEAYGGNTLYLGNPRYLEEEVVANLFAQWRSGHRVTPEVRPILQRIYDVLTGLVQRLKGTEAEAIMRRIESGEIGARARGGQVPRNGVEALGTPTVGRQLDEAFDQTVYHGTKKPIDLEQTGVSASPSTERIRNYDFGSSHLGAFFGNENAARGMGGPNLFEAQLKLNNAYEMSIDEMSHYYSPDPFIIDEALQLRLRLVEQGYDGIVVRGGEPGTPGWVNSTLYEVISFKDVPVQKVTLYEMAGPYDSLERVPIPEGYKALMRGADERSRIAWKGTPTSIYDVLTDVQDEIDTGQLLARLNAQSPLEGPAATEFARLQRTYGDELRESWETATAQEQSRAAAAFVSRQWVESLPPAQRTQLTGMAGEIAGLVSNVMNFRRAIGLFNWAAAPRQLLVQYLGNAVSFGIAAPRALVDYAKIPGLYKAFRAIRTGDPIRTDFMQEAADFGLGTNRMISDVEKTMAGSETEVRGLLGQIGNIVAPKALRDVVASPDTFARDAVARSVWRPAITRLMRELPATANRTAANFNVRRGLPLGDIQADMADILAAHRTRGQSYARIKPVELENAIRDRFRGRPGVSSDVLNDFANRVSRDFANDLNIAYQAAAGEAKRVTFSWDRSRLDEGVQNIFLYHYWATHAGGLYAKEFIKKPWMAAAFVRLGEQLMTEAQEGDYPDWLKGWTSMLNSPAGVALWFSPLDMLSTAVTFAEWQYGNDPNAFARDLTWLGQLRGWTPFVINPAIDFALWLTGAYGGEDARVPANLTGLDRLTTLGSNILNLALFNGLLPGDMGKDANGNPVPFAPRPLTDVVARLGVLSGRAVPDPFAGQHAQAKGFLQDILMEQHPEWATDPTGSDQLLAEIVRLEQESLAGNPSEEWIEAERRAVELQVTGPEFAGLPAPLRPIVGGLVRQLSPVRITAQSETKMLRQKPDIGNVTDFSAPTVGTEDHYDALDLKDTLFDTAQAAHLEMAYEQWHAGSDPELGRIAGKYWEIANGAPDRVELGSRIYTGDDLAGLSESRRYDLADEWLAGRGYSGDDLDAFYAEREALEAENPDLAGYLEYRQYVQDYPGGPVQFAADAARSSPSMARFLQQTGRTPGTEDYGAATLWADSYLAMTGQRGGIYDPTTLPDAGAVPGMPIGTNFAVERAREHAATASEPANEYEQYVADVSSEIANIDAGQQVLDELYGPGVYRAGDFLPKDVYNAALAEWKARGIYVPKREDAERAYGYFDWLGSNATAADHSVDAYIDSLDTGGGGEEPELRTPEEIAAGSLAGGVTLVESGPSGVPANAGTPASMADYVNLRTGPSQANPQGTLLPPGLPVRVVTRQNGWSQVVAPGGEVGWVPDGLLLKAAA